LPGKTRIVRKLHDDVECLNLAVQFTYTITLLAGIGQINIRIGTQAKPEFFPIDTIFEISET